MPEICVNGAGLYYEDTGSGSEAFVFSHSFLLNGNHFKYQVEALKGRYRCLAYDHRGQGRSEVTDAGYELENLYADAAGLIEALGCAPCHFVGLSMGGLVGMQIAIHRPELLKSLIMMDTPAEVGGKAPQVLKNMMPAIPRLLGWRILGGVVMKVMFGKKFRRDPARKAEAAEWKGIIQSNHLSSTLKTAKALLTWDGALDQLGGIKIPTLVIVGEHDLGAPVSQAERIANRIPGAKLVVIPHAGHLSCLEEPTAVNAAIEEFLTSLP